MNLTRFRHKRMKRLYVRDDARGVPSGTADKLRKMLFALETAENLDQIRCFPGWKLHLLKGELEAFWSLAVTGNRRLIFRYDKLTNSAEEIDLVDYH